MNDDVAATLRADPRLAQVIEREGPIELEPATDTFQRLVTAILRQQVSMDAAAAIRERLFEQFEVTPESLASADPAALEAVGLSAKKAEYVRNVAEAYIEEGYGPAYFADEPDEAVIDELTGIAGVGPWTAKMYLMFCLGREDVFPVEDLGIRQGMRALYGEELTRAEMVDAADAWRPYRSYASQYVWRVTE